MDLKRLTSVDTRPTVRGSMSIRANHVTAARLLTIPFVAALIYGDEILLVLAAFLGGLIGLTDSLDGYLARKHGPTPLGAILDPIADKVFIAATFLPYCDRGWAPYWFAAAVLVREFLVTALRTGLALRGLSQPSSLLAKVKTWVQMVGICIMVLVIAVETAWLTNAVLWGMVAINAAGGIIGWRWGTGAWRHTWVGLFPITGNALAYGLGGTDGFVLWSVVLVVGITWISAADYLTSAGQKLKAKGILAPLVSVRLVSAITIPTLATAVLVATQAPAWAIIAIMTAELAHGGFDSFLAGHGAQVSTTRWAVRNCALLGLLGLFFLRLEWSLLLGAIAAAVAVLDLSWTCWNNRRSLAAATDTTPAVVAATSASR